MANQNEDGREEFEITGEDVGDLEDVLGKEILGVPEKPVETIPHYKQGHDFPGYGAKEYRKHKTAMLVKMTTEFECDSREGTLRGQVGDYLAQDGHGGFYPISAEFHAENYEEVIDVEAEQGTNFTPKTLHNSNVSGAKKNVSDLCIVGDGDLFKLLSKASSEDEGWMKSTKAMQVPHGCVIQVTTQQRNIDGTYSVAEAATYVPGVKVVPYNETHALIAI